MFCRMTVIEARLHCFSKWTRKAFLIVCPVIFQYFVTVIKDRITWMLVSGLGGPCFCAAITEPILRTIERYLILENLLVIMKTTSLYRVNKLRYNIAYSTNSITSSQATHRKDKFYWTTVCSALLLHLLLLRLLVQGYKSVACFWLQDNTCSHLSTGRPIPRCPLCLMFRNIFSSLFSFLKYMSYQFSCFLSIPSVKLIIFNSERMSVLLAVP
jgi:hypothetical protein